MLFFEANKIEEDSKKRAILLQWWDRKAESYKELSDANKPAKTSFKEILDFLKEHQVPKPSKTAERFKFSTRSRKESESLSEYLAELRRLR